MEQEKKTQGAELRPSVAISAECAAVLLHQQQIAGLEAQLDQVMTAITTHRGNVERFKKELPDAAKLNVQFDELLAKLATGEATEEEVAGEEAKVSAVMGEMQRMAVEIERGERTVSALEKRANACCAEIMRLKQEKANLITRFLVAEAQAECERYVSAGLAAAEAYTRLLALDSMLSRRGMRPLHARAAHMFLPRFGLDACNEQKGHWFLKDSLFAVDDRFDRERRHERVAAEYKSLQDLFGVEFDD